MSKNLMFVILAILILGATPLVFACTPKITLTPTTGLSTTVVGLDFIPSSRVRIYWDGVEIPTVPYQVFTDVNGNFAAMITALDQTEGTYTISSSTATAVFTVPNLQGIQGISGLDGTNGIDGLDGVDGINGLDGAKGDTGARGATGEQGLRGYNGLQGDKGDTGLQGIQGLMGLQGIMGLTGAQGIMGLQGLTGLTGATGATGATGLKGDVGATGQSAVLDMTILWIAIFLSTVALIGVGYLYLKGKPTNQSDLK